MRSISTITTETDYTLRLTYAGGAVMVVDFKPIIAQGGVFAQLSDPNYFSQASIGERGRFIQWPDDLDFCADALWLDGKADHNTAA